jgi:hypothetical protein
MLLGFDQNTMANMTAALEHVCKQLPAENDNHETRKRIADAMIACAETGRRTYLDLKDAGLATLKQVTRPPGNNWLGLLGRQRSE